jgi:hypothetical protein
MILYLPMSVLLYMNARGMLYFHLCLSRMWKKGDWAINLGFMISLCMYRQPHGVNNLHIASISKKKVSSNSRPQSTKLQLASCQKNKLKWLRFIEKAFIINSLRTIQKFPKNNCFAKQLVQLTNSLLATSAVVILIWWVVTQLDESWHN